MKDYRTLPATLAAPCAIRSWHSPLTQRLRNGCTPKTPKKTPTATARHHPTVNNTYAVCSPVQHRQQRPLLTTCARTITRPATSSRYITSTNHPGSSQSLFGRRPPSALTTSFPLPRAYGGSLSASSVDVTWESSFGVYRIWPWPIDNHCHNQSTHHTTLNIHYAYTTLLANWSWNTGLQLVVVGCHRLLPSRIFQQDWPGRGPILSVGSVVEAATVVPLQYREAEQVDSSSTFVIPFHHYPHLPEPDSTCSCSQRHPSSPALASGVLTAPKSFPSPSSIMPLASTSAH